MDNRQKIIIGVVIVALVLFVAAMVVQTRSDEGDASTASTDRGNPLRSLAGEPPGVRLDELSGDCQRQGGTLVAVGGCALVVAPSGERMRMVRLRTQQLIRITGPAPEGADFEVTDELEAGKEAAIAVDRDGAEITLDCLGSTCSVELLGTDR